MRITGWELANTGVPEPTSHLFQGNSGMPREKHAGRGQFDTSSLSHGKFKSEFVLETADGPAEGRRCHSQLSGRRREASLLDDHREVGQIRTQREGVARPISMHICTIHVQKSLLTHHLPVG